MACWWDHRFNILLQSFDVEELCVDSFVTYDLLLGCGMYRCGGIIVSTSISKSISTDFQRAELTSMRHEKQYGLLTGLLNVQS